MNTGIDVSTGCIKEENITIEIDNVERKSINNKILEEAKRVIIAAYKEKTPDFYKNLREPDFEGCEIKELVRGFSIIKESFKPSKQKNKIWFDNQIIISAYQKDDNFDAFILGVYYGLRAYTKEHIFVLNRLFPLLKENDLTTYDSFKEYCASLNTINDKKEIDEDKYQKLLNDKLFNTKLLDE